MICTLGHIRLVEISAGKEYTYTVNAQGEGKDIKKEVGVDVDYGRYYVCTNCGMSSNGEESFTMRTHLGKHNETVDPFEIESRR